jgi:hypothetical protein
MRDNVGGVAISGNPPEFTDTESERIFQSFIHISSLEYQDSDPDILLSLHEIKGILRARCANNRHHDNDQVHKATLSGKVANSRIGASYIRERDKLGHARGLVNTSTNIGDRRLGSFSQASQLPPNQSS